MHRKKKHPIFVSTTKQTLTIMATLTQQQATENFNKVMGVETELTIRGKGMFTISFDGENNNAVARLKKYLGKTVEFEGTEYCEECDQTVIYFKAI